MSDSAKSSIKNEAQELQDRVEAVASKAAARAEDLTKDYSPDEERPLSGYVRAMSVYSAIVGTALVVGKAKGVKLPASIKPGDFALMAVGTHKIARIIAKDAITSPIRAPFTQYKEPSGASELMEEVRGTGWRHAVGELLECPFCMAVWVATAFSIGFAVAPRFTRWVGATFSAVAVSDYMQFAYDGVKNKTQ